MYITVENDKVHCVCEVKWSCEVNSKVHKVPYLLVNHWFRFYVKFSIIYIKDKIYKKKKKKKYAFLPELFQFTVFE